MIDDDTPGEKRRVEFVGGPNDGETALMHVSRVQWMVATREHVRDVVNGKALQEVARNPGEVGVYRRTSATEFTWQGYR